MKAGFLELRDLQDRPITTLSFHSLTGKAELRDEWKTVHTFSLFYHASH
jgi:hypothetical protein